MTCHQSTRLVLSPIPHVFGLSGGHAEPCMRLSESGTDDANEMDR